ESFKEFSIGGVLLFILSTPIILVTLVMKNYVPTIIFTVVITLINVMGGSSEHRALFRWAAAGDIANHTLPSTNPLEYSFTDIILINVMGGSSEHRALFPWAAAGDIANHTLPSTYPPEYSYTAIIVTALTGFIALIVYFKKADIH